MEAVTNLNEEVIKLTGKDVDSRLFNATFNRLCQFQFSNPKIAYNIGYIAEKVKSITKDIMMEHGKLLDKYAEKNAEGGMELDEKNNVKISDENKPKYKADLGSVHEIEI